MKIIGLTGGSGAGKSLVCEAFFSYGVKSIDTDKISREVTKKDSECLRELTEYFTKNILTHDGELDRKKLAEIVFSNGKNLDILNRITHEYILERCKDVILDMQKTGEKSAIIDAPVLFESGFDKHCDIIISVISDRKKRIERIIKRDNITKSQVENRIKNQKSDEFFIEHSDYIIYNNSDYENIKTQVSEIYKNIKY